MFGVWSAVLCRGSGATSPCSSASAPASSPSSACSSRSSSALGITQARVRHRPGQLPQQGRPGLQGQRRLPGPLRRPGDAHRSSRWTRGTRSTSSSNRRTARQIDEASKSLARQRPGARASSAPPTALEFSDNLVTSDGRQPAQQRSPARRSPARTPSGRPPRRTRRHAHGRTSGATLQRGSSPSRPTQRTLDNPEWVNFLLYDNEGEIRKALRPFFPDDDHAQIVTRLKGNDVDRGRGRGRRAHRRRTPSDARRSTDATTVTTGAPGPAQGHQRLPQRRHAHPRRASPSRS